MLGRLNSIGQNRCVGVAASQCDYCVVPVERLGVKRMRCDSKAGQKAALRIADAVRRSGEFCRAMASLVKVLMSPIAASSSQLLD